MAYENNIKKYYQQVSKIITYKDFVSKIENKQNLLGDLCDEEMCIQLVLNDLNIIQKIPENNTNNVNINKTENKQLKTIKEIKNIEKDEYVSFFGKVISISNIKEFKRKDDSLGRVQNLFLIDNSGQIKINIWDDKTQILQNENIKFNSIILIRGFAKKIQNIIEVNVNTSGFIGTSNEETNINLKSTPINLLNDNNENYIIEGKIIDISSIKIFHKQDDSEGKLKQLVIGDKTGKIKVNLWNQQIDLNSELKINDSIILTHFYIKKNSYSKCFELSIVNNYKIEKLLYEIEYIKCNQITEFMNNINILGQIIDISEIRTFIKKDGTEGTVGNITVGDETGKIQLTLWNENTVYLDEYNFNDIIFIKNCFSKMNDYTKQIEIYLISESTIEKSSIDIKYIEKITNISEIKVGYSYSIYGSIKQIKNEEDNFQDYNNNYEQYNKIILEDDTGSITIHCINFQNDLLNQLKIGDKIKITNVCSKYDKLENIILDTTSKSIIN